MLYDLPLGRFSPSALTPLCDMVRQQLGQDRQDPSGLSRVFLAGATAGGLCAMLETPVRALIHSISLEPLADPRVATLDRGSQVPSAS